MHGKIKKKRILIIDDSNYQRRKTKKLLKDNGYSVHEAEDGLQGLCEYRKKPADIVLLDINMPIMEGLEVLDFIFRIDSSATVIMYSTLDEKKIIMQSIKKGAADYLVKPSSPEVILKTIEKHLERNQLEINGDE